MRLSFKHLVVLGTLLALGTTAWAGKDDAWLHIKVEEHGRRGETVRVNLPFQLIEAVLPLIDTHDYYGEPFHIRNGKIEFDCEELSGIELGELLRAVRDAEEAEYVTVEGPDERVRVAKKDGQLRIRVEDDYENVDVNLRLDVVDAMLSDDPEELDIIAMVRALAESGGGELVSVEGEDETVRIWIDEKNESD